MGFFSNQSRKEAEERARWAAERHGEADEAIRAYKKGKISREDVRRELARHDDYFDYTE